MTDIKIGRLEKALRKTSHLRRKLFLSGALLQKSQLRFLTCLQLRANPFYLGPLPFVLHWVGGLAVKMHCALIVLTLKS